MPRKRETRAYQCGPFYLSQVPGSDTWYIAHYAKEKRQTVKYTLGTTDREAAEEAIAAHHLKWLREQGVKPSQSTAITLKAILDDDYQNHAKHLASAGDSLTAIGYWTDAFPNLAVADLTKAQVRQFMSALAARDYAPTYINRILGVCRGALARAVDADLIEAAPTIPLYKPLKPKPKLAKGRDLTIAELARLFLAADTPHMPVFMAIMLNTLCRPGAATDLGPEQVNLSRGVIDLNPEGRVQTAKQRPELPLPRTLRPWLRGRNTKTFVHMNGERVKKVRKAWRTMVRRAGLAHPKRVVPYSIRHTMATELSDAGITNEIIGRFLGHGVLRDRAGKTTRGYISPKATQMREAQRVIERFCVRLRAEVKRQAKTWKPVPKQPGKRTDLLAA